MTLGRGPFRFVSGNRAHGSSRRRHRPLSGSSRKLSLFVGWAPPAGPCNGAGRWAVPTLQRIRGGCDRSRPSGREDGASERWVRSAPPSPPGGGVPDVSCVPDASCRTSMPLQRPTPAAEFGPPPDRMPECSGGIGMLAQANGGFARRGRGDDPSRTGPAGRRGQRCDPLIHKIGRRDVGVLGKPVDTTSPSLVPSPGRSARWCPATARRAGARTWAKVTIGARGTRGSQGGPSRGLATIRTPPIRAGPSPDGGLATGRGDDCRGRSRLAHWQRPGGITLTASRCRGASS